MKIIQINNVYRTGSTGKIAYDIHTYLQSKGIDSMVCYGRLDAWEEMFVVKTCGEFEASLNRIFTRITGLLYGSCFFSTNTLIKIIKKEKPDVVHLQCINGFFVNIYRIINFLKKEKIRTILTLHAEFMYTANCGHALDCERWKHGCGKCPRLKEETCSFFFDNTDLSWKKMKNAFEGFNHLTVVSVSPWLQNRAQQSPILADKNHVTILNGIDTNIFNNLSKEKLSKLNKYKNKRIVFHATAEFSDVKEHLKGGYYVLEIAKRFLETDSQVIFLVAGKSERIENIPENVILLGNITDQKRLAEYYNIADVTLLTSKKETFSMVVAESLCCGTPVVGFEAGAPELIALEEYSSFVLQGDCDKLYDKLKEFLGFESWDSEEISAKAIKKYSKEVMGKKYLNLYKEMMK